MPFLRLRCRPSSMLRQARTQTLPLASWPSSRRFATQGYGDGTGDPKGSDPQNQGASNATKHHAEHPGPGPPAVGSGTGGGATKGGSGPSHARDGSSGTPADASAQSGGSRSKEAVETGSSPTAGQIGGGGGGGGGPEKGKARPVIHDRRVPEVSANRKAEVDRHNRDFEKRHDRAAPAHDDTVDKDFGKGHGGMDNSP